MTFLSDIKREICETHMRSACCRRALLLGVLSAKAHMHGEKILLSFSDATVMEYIVRLIKEQFGREATAVPSTHGGRLRTLCFESAAAAKLLCEDAEDFSLAKHQRCEGCSHAFLRGVFLASGRISDPQKAYRIELSLGERAEWFRKLLVNEYGISFSLTVRRGETLLYVKDSSLVEELLMMLGINDAAFSLMNAKIEKEFRNEANRRTNCEAGNISRSVTAATRTVAVLRRLEKENLLSSLPDELEDAARLRLAHPEASLSQLAAMMTPPITKSGLNHRLCKVLEYAQSIAPIQDN